PVMKKVKSWRVANSDDEETLSIRGSEELLWSIRRRLLLISTIKKKYQPDSSFLSVTEALGQTAPSLSKPSAQREKGKYTEEKWSRRLCTSSCSQDHKSKWCMKEMYKRRG
ncbi:hypothetical protein GBF38_012738, partial [Nibea albiflora]